MTSVADRIGEVFDDLSPAQKRVARIVLESFPSGGLRSAQALADAAGTSPASVVRFVARLGYAGLPDFHQALRADIDRRLRSPFELFTEDADAGDAFLERIRRSEVHIVSETIGKLTERTLNQVRELLADTPRLWVLGGRFSQSVAHYLYAHLNLFRPGVQLLDPVATPLADHVVHARRGTCAVIFDFRRYQREATFTAQAVKRRRGKVIVVTDPYRSPATQYADLTLLASVERPTLLDSHTGATALVDVLVSDLLRHHRQQFQERLDEVESTRAHLAAMAFDDEAVPEPPAMERRHP